MHVEDSWVRARKKLFESGQDADLGRVKKQIVSSGKRLSINCAHVSITAE